MQGKNARKRSKEVGMPNGKMMMDMKKTHDPKVMAKMMSAMVAKSK